MNEPLTLLQNLNWFLFLLGQGGMLIGFYAIVAVPVVPLSIFLYRVYRKEIDLPNIWPWLIFSTIVPVVMGIIGTIFYDTQNEIAGLFSFSLLVLYLLVGLIVLIRAKGYRIFIACTGLLFLAFTTLTALAAGMSIDNTWL